MSLSHLSAVAGRWTGEAPGSRLISLGGAACQAGRDEGRRKLLAGQCRGGCARKIGGYDAARSAGRPGAPVAELVDAADSKSVARKGVLVRVRPGAPNENQKSILDFGVAGEAS